MRGLVAAGVLGAVLAFASAPAHAQLPEGGYFANGAYYAPGPAPTPASSQDETAYARGVYAYAPGFGPYLRLGGESGWNPSLGSTYNAYPFGDYYSDYGLPSPIPYYAGWYGWAPYGAGAMRYGPYPWWPYGSSGWWRR